MNVTTIDEKKVFKPITLQIEFNTEEEVAAFYALLNYSPVVNSVARHIKLGRIRTPLRKAYEKRGQKLAYNDIFDNIRNYLKQAV